MRVALHRGQGRNSLEATMHKIPLFAPIVHLLLTGVSVLVVAHVLPGIQVRSYWSAVKFAFVAGLLNAVVWSMFRPLSVIFSVVTLGIGALILNGIIFLVAGAVVRGVRISGCVTGAIASIGVWLVNQILHSFLHY
jgi:putative membrane protein